MFTRSSSTLPSLSDPSIHSTNVLQDVLSPLVASSAHIPQILDQIASTQQDILKYFKISYASISRIRSVIDTAIIPSLHSTQHSCNNLSISLLQDKPTKVVSPNKREAVPYSSAVTCHRLVHIGTTIPITEELPKKDGADATTPRPFRNPPPIQRGEQVRPHFSMTEKPASPMEQSSTPSSDDEDTDKPPAHRTKRSRPQESLTP